MKLYNIVFSPTGGTKKVSALLTDALEGEAANVDPPTVNRIFARYS